MNPAELAKAARERLSLALNALQTNEDVPDELMRIADTIADTMRLLHRIERSGGKDLHGREAALSNVREILNELQKLTVLHPATEAVTDAVAESLSKVHALNKFTPKEATAALPRAHIPIGPSGTAYIAPQQPPNGGFPQKAAAEMRAPEPTVAAPARQAEPAPKQEQAFTSTLTSPEDGAASQLKRRSSTREAPQVLQGGPLIDVELGTHSGSNFYKGLGGNDVVEHGGIFVATYKIPKLGTSVILRVLLPGDYEFQASATVQWVREAGSAEPGFGARFAQVNPEGRQLIYRYTRNREPMFYDDL